MSDHSKAVETRFEWIEKRVTLVLAIAAFMLSLFNFASDHLFKQYVLRAAVVALEEDASTVSAKLLLVNPGKHDETLYSARFLFGGRTYGITSVGPITVKSGEARVVTLREPFPNIEQLREDGTASDRLHIAVEFLPITREGQLPEDGTVYGFTEWRLNGNMKVGATPAPGDRSGLVDLRL